VTKSIYCHNCKKHFNVREVDIELMKRSDSSFNAKEYTKGCFFKELTKLKRLKKLANSGN
jgi:hypothetical protein